MKEIGYRSWALIPVDPEPATGEATVSNPPMLTAIAVDRGASLVFCFASPPGDLHLAVEATALSAENRSPNLFRVFTGSAGNAFRELKHSGWKKRAEGIYTTFATQVEGVDTYLKLAFNEEKTLIVNRVTFSH